MIEFVPMSSVRGDVRVNANRARRLAFGLACFGAVADARPWTAGRPLELPDAPIDAIETPRALVMHAWNLSHDDDPGMGPWGTGTDPEAFDFWRPDVGTAKSGVLVDTDSDADGVLWYPWGARHVRRHIFIGWSGHITWDTGTGKPSRFIGGCLVAAANGLSNLPNGSVSMARVVS